MSGPERMRVVIFSGTTHPYIAQAFAVHPRFEVVAVAEDPSAPAWAHPRNESLATDLSVPYIRDIDAAVAQFQPQVACVSSEIARHADLSVRAAEAGLHIVQDKPMAPRVEDCDRVIAAVERAGVRFLMWNRNTHPAVVQARQLVDAGEIGQPFAIHADFYFSKDAGALIGSGEHETISDTWGGEGELSLEGVYPLAYIHYLLQADVRRVFARTTAHFFQRHADRGVEDLATVTLEMAHGVAGSLCIGRIGRPSHPNLGELRLHILGSDGALVVAEPRPEVAVYARGLKPDDYRHRRIGVDYERRLLDDFAHAIDTGSDTMLNVYDSRAIVATVVAAVQSGKTGQPVDVPHR